MLYRHQQRQTITVKLPKSAGILRKVELCGQAVRKKHKSMLRLAPDDSVGASRLMTLTATEAIYEVWIRNAKEASAP